MPAGKQQVLIISDITEWNPKFANDFSKKFECIHYTVPAKKEDFFADLKGKLKNISAIWAMWAGFSAYGTKVGDDIISQLPKSVKIFAISPVGYDRYDIESFTKHGIIVSNSRALGSNAVADIALHLLLSTFRFTTALELSLRKEQNLFLARSKINSTSFIDGKPKPRSDGSFAFGDNVGGRVVTSPAGHNCGILGLGAIGKNIARRVATLNMNVHYFTRTPIDPEILTALPPMTAHSDLDEFFSVSDALILALPLTEDTKYIVNATTLAKLPSGARIINVGRGGLINTDDLVAALDAGHISAAGLDVYEAEPAIPANLLERWDVTLLPHVGSATIETVEQAENGIMANIENVLLEGGRGITPLNNI
ncbi:D-isomer specific 2-hydroxyacid dehydrogenase [Lipomyces japonicus]|uniref:D-isomer specific 2-hydroxyacid dehydrogenase n=1 Tax=Lipomyces japonicus TaxID=56871 RepID=UPI0034CF9BA3